jgi:Spy/CpxP family protein refolding chaperone
MQTYSKAALAVLALALSCTPVLAQGDPQDAPPAEQGMARGGVDPGGPMRNMGPGDKRGGWGRMDDGFGGGGRMGSMDHRGMGRMGMRRFGRGGRGFGLERLLNDPALRQQVGITDEQAAKIRTETSTFRKTEIRDRADLQVKRIDLRDLLAAQNPDRAAIDSKLQEISASQLALEKSAVDFRLNMRDAITPEQRQKIRQLMSERRRGGGAGHFGPRGAGHRGPGQRGMGQPPKPAGPPQTQPPPEN